MYQFNNEPNPNKQHPAIRRIKKPPIDKIDGTPIEPKKDRPDNHRPRPQR